MSREKQPWACLFFDPNWVEFHTQPEGPTEGMVPLFAGHESFNGEVREYEVTVEGFAPDEPTARLYGAADDLADVVSIAVELLTPCHAATPEAWEERARKVERFPAMAHAALAKAKGETL